MKPADLTLRRQGVVRGLRRDGCMGRARQTRTQPGGEVSDQLGFISEVGQFRERSALERSASRTGEQRSGRLAE